MGIAFEQIAAVWREAALAADAVTAIWFEADRRPDLLKPKEPFAFHVSVRDEDFDSFVSQRREFIEAVGPIATERLENVAWPYPPTWRVMRNTQDAGMLLVTSWVVFADGTEVDLVIEKNSKAADVPRAFWKSVCDKSLGIQGKLMRGRIGKGNRIIRKRPLRTRC